MTWTPEKQKQTLELQMFIEHSGNLFCPGPIWAQVWLCNLLPGILILLSSCAENVSSSIAN